MKATTTGSESIHVTSPIFNPALYDNNTQVKRKMTVALLPFTIKESDTANIRAGLGPLLSTGAYPGSGPYGVPSIDGTNNCAQSANAPDNIGIEYLAVHNDGTVVMATCGDGSSNKVNLETGVDVTKYSVLTVETSGVFCSTCTDNVLNGTAWVFFRFYQEDTTGKIIGSTDKNHNFTSNIAPLAGTNYATVFQQNNNAGATSQTSKVDFVQVQNYGSPVCLIAPTGQLCTKLPFNPGHLTSDVIGTFAYIASLLGGGDEQAGAIVLFLILSAGFAGAPLLITRSLTWGLFGEESVVGFFVYAGFLPAWILFLLILGAAVIVVMMVNKLVSGHGMGGGDMG